MRCIGVLILLVSFEAAAQQLVNTDPIRLFLPGGQPVSFKTMGWHRLETNWLKICSDSSSTIYAPFNVTIMDTFTVNEHLILKLKVNGKNTVLIGGLQPGNWTKGSKVEKGSVLGTVKLFPGDRQFKLYCMVLQKKSPLPAAEALKFLEELP
ncbi:MAG: hypothetical protein J7578_21745 [Chitinophagaceae bacterium]|nr:hypothetical protein [Chitinophagaceae bacterium]